MVDPPLWPLGDDPEGWPTVSVVMPVRNEAENIRASVEAVLAQDYPRPFDVCLAIGPSDDGTGELARSIADASERVTIVDNPACTTPAGLNAAIRSSNGQVVVRVDGHSRLSEGYIRRAVETMATTGAVNVGGIQHAVGQTPFEEAVASAMTSWFGTGGSRYRVGGKPGPVDTVYLGVFDRAAGDAVGWFDEALARNQDYELNIRLRQAGGTVWFDPELWVDYRPRGDPRSLARQYYEYGWWKARVARQHPRSLRSRQIAPPLALLALLGSLSIAAGQQRRRRHLLAFAAVTSAATARVGRARPIVLVVPTIHLSWAVGFLTSSSSLAASVMTRHTGSADGAETPARRR